MKTLVVAPSWVGDAVMAHTVVSALHAEGAEIHVLAPEWVAGIVERMAEVARLHVYPARHGHLDLAMRMRVASRLRGEAFDRAIVLPNNMKSALIPFLARIPRRIGFLGEMRWFLLTDVRGKEPGMPGLAQRYAALAGGEMRRPRLVVSREASIACARRLQLDTKRPAIGLCIGSEYGGSKRWPAQRFAELSRELSRRGFDAWIFGGVNDGESARLIEEQSPAINLVGRISLPEAIDLMAATRGVVTNDTGMMHVAAAIGTPLVAVYGATLPEWAPPLTDAAVVLETPIECRPCHRPECPLGHLECLMRIGADRVIEGLGALRIVDA